MTSKLRATAISTALVLFIVACGGSADSVASTTQAGTIGEADATATTDAAPTPAPEVEAPTPAPEVEAPTPEPASPAVFESGAALLLGSFRGIEPGTHRVDGLGTAFSFTTTEQLFVQPNGPGFFVISVPNSVGPDDRDIVFFRPTGLMDPTDLAADPAESDEWPMNDFRGWVDNVMAGVNVSEPMETTVGGASALYTELTLTDDFECGNAFPGYCAGFAGNVNQDGKSFQPGSTYRIWWVDQGDEDPIGIAAAIDDDDEVPWFDTVDDVLGSVAFAETAPNPVRLQLAGMAEFRALGGFRTELAEEAVIIERIEGHAVVRFDVPGVVEMGINPLSADGAELLSVGDLLATLEAEGLELIESDPVTIGGLQARVVDFSGSADGVLLSWREQELESDQLGWFAPPLGRLWLIDHPDRGVLMISSLAFRGGEETLAPLTAWVEEIIPTLEFI